jgi:hypothetical protein
MSDAVRTRRRVEVTGHAKDSIPSLDERSLIGIRLAAWLTRDLVTLWLAACPL